MEKSSSFMNEKEEELKKQIYDNFYKEWEEKLSLKSFFDQEDA